MFCLVSKNVDETISLGESLGRVMLDLWPLDEFRDFSCVIGLLGDLGAGKTHFCKGVARGIGISDTISVTSPTFTIINEYRAQIPLFHIDLYRLSEFDELMEVGVDACFRTPGLCLVEWLDRFPEATPADALSVTIQFGMGTADTLMNTSIPIAESEESRTLCISYQGNRTEQIANTWLTVLGLAQK